MLADQATDHAAARGLRFEQFDRLAEREARRIGPLGDGGVDLAVINIGAKPAGLHADLAALRMLAEFAPSPRRSPTRRRRGRGSRRSCRVAHTNRNDRCRRRSGRRSSDDAPLRAAKRAAPTPFRASRRRRSIPWAATIAWAYRPRPAECTR